MKRVLLFIFMVVFSLLGMIRAASAETISYIDLDMDHPNSIKIMTYGDTEEVTLRSGTVTKVYDNSVDNHFMLEKNSGAIFMNVRGSNTIQLDSEFNLFSISRSGAMVTFEGNDKTILKIPATLTVQNIVFNDQTLNLYIESSSVMLGDQEILMASEYGPEPKVGYFIDGPVEGLSYETSSGKTGNTGSNGEFYYDIYDTITFKLGSLPLGAEVTASSLITPLEICETEDLTTSIKAINVVRLLLTLDTGDNPFGLSLPDIDSSVMDESFDLQSLLEKTTDFGSELESFIEAVTDLEIDPADIPSEQDAEDHFKLSQELIKEIEQGTDKNLFVTVKVPEGKSGYVYLNFRRDGDMPLPPGVDSYESGGGAVINNATQSATFSHFLYAGDWHLTLFQLEDVNHVQPGDLFSFYNTQGFQSTQPLGYPLHKGTSNVNLRADFSTDGAVVEQVYAVSGTIQVPKYLPDGTDLALSSENTCLTIFYDIQESQDNIRESVASFHVNPDWPTSSEWTTVTEDSVEYYVVDYSTTLPAGFLLRSQIYLHHRTPGDGEDDYELVEFYTFNGPLNADVNDIDYASLENWEIKKDYDFSARERTATSFLRQNKKSPVTEEVFFHLY